MSPPNNGHEGGDELVEGLVLSFVGDGVRGKVNCENRLRNLKKSEKFDQMISYHIFLIVHSLTSDSE